MGRYNKVFAGPVTEVLPQVQEAQCNGALLPASLVVLSSGDWVYAGTSTVGKVWVLQENYLKMLAAADAYTSGDTGMGMELVPGLLYNVRVATGNNLTKGDALMPGANGVLVKAAGNKKMVVAHADESYNNTSGADQLVRVRAAIGYMTPSSAA